MNNAAWSEETADTSLQRSIQRANYAFSCIERMRVDHSAEGLRVAIWRLQEYMVENCEKGPEAPVESDFFDDDEGNHFYARTIHMPKGFLVIGKIHRHAHDNFLLKGRCLVVTEFDGVREIRAPYAFDSVAGTKRVVLCFEETEWTTLHDNPDNVKSVAEIEPYVIASSYAELGMTEPKQLLEEAIHELGVRIDSVGIDSIPGSCDSDCGSSHHRKRDKGGEERP
jgi:hypothetical protein